MRKVSLICFVLVLNLTSKAQNISGVINDYAQVNAINLNVISLSSATNFNVGDRVLIIKMKGATINQTNTFSYGDSVTLNDAGFYLFANIIAKTGNDVTLDTFCNIFSTVQYIQLVRVPIFPNPIVTATLSCAPWNGTTGGVLVFATPGALTLNANIDVSRNGFRGGALQGMSFNCGSTDYFSAFPGNNGQKGEGIADYIVGQQGGAGKLLNGGGGAYAGNTGAGGGGNVGAGGRGGDQWSGCSPTNKFGIGGLGILPKNHAMILGGGGGGPQADNGQLVFPGGNGGGIVFIAANSIVGNGNSILANGGNVAQTNDEGASAGGAGGSIYLMANSYNTPLTVNARGGNGGSNNNTIYPTFCHGPGGGGGGGLIWFSNPATPAGVTTNITGGNSGLVLNTSSTCFNTGYNALGGAVGSVNFNFVPVKATIVNPNLGPDQPICIGETITLNPGAGYASYLWDDFSVNPTRNVQSPGTYSVTVLNSLGCVGSDTLEIYLDTSVQASFTYTLNLGCTSDTISFNNTSVGSTNYLWSFGDGNFSTQASPTHIYGAQGVYNIRLIVGSTPCFDTTSIQININHTVDALFTINDDSICLGEPVIFSSVSTPVGFGVLDLVWDFGDGTIVNSPIPLQQHYYTAPGIYRATLYATDTLGCTDSMFLRIYVEEKPYLDFSISDDTLCVGDIVYFTDSLSPNTLNWLWDFGDGTPLLNVHNPVRSYEESGVYNVTLTGNYAICPSLSKDTTILVNSYPLINLGEDKTFCPGLITSVTLKNESNSSAIMQWSNGEASPSITVSEPGYYWAGMNNQGCSSSDSIWVKRDCYLNIPNAFSPDGDGLNDTFIPRDLLAAGLKAFDMKIYNRWGEVIFQTNKIDGLGWDGKFGGQVQPMGVYVYVIEAQWINNFKNTFQGNLTLLR